LPSSVNIKFFFTSDAFNRPTERTQNQQQDTHCTALTEGGRTYEEEILVTVCW